MHITNNEPWTEIVISCVNSTYKCCCQQLVQIAQRTIQEGVAFKWIHIMGKILFLYSHCSFPVLKYDVEATLRKKVWYACGLFTKTNFSCVKFLYCWSFSPGVLVNLTLWQPWMLLISTTFPAVMISSLPLFTWVF